MWLSKRTGISGAILGIPLLLLNGCADGRRLSGTADPPGSGGFGDVTVSATLATADTTLAEALGWSGGVPGAEVWLARNGTATWTIRTTDSNGTVVFDDLIPGRYRLYAGRRLTMVEAEAAGGIVRAFGDGRTFDVPQTSAVLLELYGDRPGGLVISEINSAVPPPWETGGSYLDGTYFEVYNNADAAAYLDGLLFGFAFRGDKDYAHTPCTISQPVRADASALHGRWFLQFPGGGSTYPILPGEAKVVAVAAIDHTPVHPQLLDLRDADFEIGSSQSADNPSVPNMLDVGLEVWHPALLAGDGNLYHLSEPTDPRELPITFRDVNGRGYVRIPTNSVLDAAAFIALWPDQDMDVPPCIPVAAPVFERYEGGLYEIGFGVTDPTESLQRLVLRHEGGRAILQNANTSAVDFVLARQTPGWVP